MDESGRDIVERSPRQWRIPGPRWLPLVIAALMLAAGATALAAGGGGRAGGSGVQPPALCLPVHVASGQHAAPGGVHLRCFHSLA